MSSILPPPVTVHIPVDEHHGIILTLLYNPRERAKFADLDTPTGVRVEEVTSAADVKEVCGCTLAFTGRMLADLRPDGIDSFDRPEIYALLAAHDLELPERKLRELERSGKLDNIPRLPAAHEMNRLSELIARENEAMRLTPESMDRVRIAGGRVLLARRMWYGMKEAEDKLLMKLLGREVVVDEVDWQARTATVFEPSLFDEGPRRMTVPLDALALTHEMRLAEQPGLYVPPNVRFQKGDKVRVNATIGNNMAGFTGMVMGYATRKDEMRGATWDAPGYAVRYDNQRYVDYFESGQLDAVALESNDDALPTEAGGSKTKQA